MILDATNRKLQVLLGGAVTTNQLPVVTNWADLTDETTTPGASTAATNSATAVDIVTAPAADTRRVVQSINVFNADTVDAEVTVRYVDNATNRILVKATLQPDNTLYYSQQYGWVVQAY